MAAYPPAPPPVAARQGANPHRTAGLLLALPAALLALITLVVPTGQTIFATFEKNGGMVRGFGGGASGARNYEVLGKPTFWEALGFSLALAIIPLLVALVVGPLLAAALDRSGTWPRRVGRVLMSVPLVVFSPVAIAGAWLVSRRGDGSPLLNLGAPSGRGIIIMLVVGAGTFGAVSGLALLVFLAVFRGRVTGRPLTRAMVAVGGIIALAAAAYGLQSFTFSSVLTGGRPETLATLQDHIGLLRFDFGGGMVIATVTGLLVGVLGVAAAYIAIKVGLRIELRPARRPGAPPEDDGRRPGGPVIGVIALVIVLVIFVLCSWPWLSQFLGLSHQPGIKVNLRTPGDAYVNTWVPPILNTIISVGAAFLAALGIGGIRPFGRRSEWALMGFAPWLFVGVGPLSLTFFKNADHLHLLRHFVVLVSPILISVPSLFLLTFFCRPRSERWRAQVAEGAPAAPAFFSQVVVPALPLAGLLAVANILLGAQGLVWTRVVSLTSYRTIPLLVLTRLLTFGENGSLFRSLTPIVVIVLALIVVAVLQIMYLDRLVISTDAPENTTGARTAWQQPPYPGYAPPPGPGGWGPPPQGAPMPPPGYGPPPQGLPQGQAWQGPPWQGPQGQPPHGPAPQGQPPQGPPAQGAAPPQGPASQGQPPQGPPPGSVPPGAYGPPAQPPWQAEHPTTEDPAERTIYDARHAAEEPVDDSPEPPEGRMPPPQ
jgi:hypothetical protein